MIASPDAEWARHRLAVDVADADWPETERATELLFWVRRIAMRRAIAQGVAAADRDDVAQDCVLRMLHALVRTRHRIATANNPAALLERATYRASNEARHRVNMVGLGGTAPNGRTIRVPFPVAIGGEAGQLILENLPAPIPDTSPQIDRMASRIADWVESRLDVVLTPDAVHAVTYVLDRLVAGVGRSSLTRGGHSALRTDPAMRHLGLSSDAAAGFAGWLLGPTNATPGVLDAILDADPPEEHVIQGWRASATRLGIAVPIAAAA